MSTLLAITVGFVLLTLVCILDALRSIPPSDFPTHPSPTKKVKLAKELEEMYAKAWKN